MLLGRSAFSVDGVLLAVIVQCCNKTKVSQLFEHIVWRIDLRLLLSLIILFRRASRHSKMNAFIVTGPITLGSVRSSPTLSSALSSFISPRRSYARRMSRVLSGMRMGLEPLAATTQLLSDNPAFLQKIVGAFQTLNMPEPLVQYGHPAMMGFMVLGMGLPGAVIGWQGRLNENKKEGVQQKKLHENIMLAFFLLAFLGGTGGTLSTAMQGYDVWQTPHASSALVVLLLLGANSFIAYSGFTIGNDGTPKGRLQGRKLHSYFGIAAMTAFAVHAFLGVQILLG